MKKKQIIGLILLVIGLLAITLMEENKWLFNKESNVTFQRKESFLLGRNRAFIYSVSDTLWSEIENHGKNLDHKKGTITAAFYYLNNTRIPRISSAKNFIDAIDKGQTSDCVAAFWINGDTKLIKFPARAWSYNE
ncbi:hypothetical protein BH23BAC1_BH23BAC1_16240 [soil metagenome]